MYLDRHHQSQQRYHNISNQGFEVGLCTSTCTRWSLEIHIRWGQVRDRMTNMPSIATIINGVFPPLYLNLKQGMASQPAYDSRKSCDEGSPPAGKAADTDVFVPSCMFQVSRWFHKIEIWQLDKNLCLPLLKSKGIWSVGDTTYH
jgi:hypothetical protein